MFLIVIKHFTLRGRHLSTSLISCHIEEIPAPVTTQWSITGKFLAPPTGHGLLLLALVDMSVAKAPCAGSQV